jgi:hypothetical protein
MPETTVNVRYIVDDVDAAITWYTRLDRALGNACDTCHALYLKE